MPLNAMGLIDEAKRHIAEVNPEEDETLISKAPVPDVQEPAESALGTFLGALNLPCGVLEFKIDSHPTRQDARDADILVYRETGGRPALATEAFEKQGETKISRLAGGFKAWRESGLSVKTPPSS